MNQTLLPTPNQVSPYALSHNNGILTLKISPLSSLSETLSPSGAILWSFHRESKVLPWPHVRIITPQHMEEDIPPERRGKPELIVFPQLQLDGFQYFKFSTRSHKEFRGIREFSMMLADTCAVQNGKGSWLVQLPRTKRRH